ncbi:MAG: hypothetical protein JRG91_14860, partial [Deltaproteobacteria bacterium]|nr:hypothetical protein [Deltaproteobacteria bacterium]
PKPPPVQPTCYAPVPPPMPPMNEKETEAFERIQKKIGLLEDLQKKGKLTDASFEDGLAKMKKDIAILETNREACFQVLGNVELDLVNVRRDMEAKDLAAMEKEASWTTLEKQYAELHEYLAGKKNVYDDEAVKEALGKLEKKKLITPATGDAVAAVFTQVVYHYDRSHGGKTCYDMTNLGADMMTWRGSLTSFLKDLKGKKLDDATFQYKLYTLAPTLECLQIQKNDVCDTSSQTDAYTRTTVIETLAVLEALGK